jgi:oxygen-dependent protoporphyrinogen oxidase
MARVAVLGAGITGLAAAFELARAGVEVVVYERSDRVGGKLRTTPLAVDGFTPLLVEEGADAFLVRRPEAAALAADLGLDLVHPSTGPAQVFAGGRLRTLPPGTLLGVPGSLRGLSAVLSPLGLARAAADLVLPGAGSAADRSVGDLVRRRLGRQVLDRMVDPLLGGVYAGTADNLSVAATVPALVDPQRSLLRTVSSRTAATAAGASGPVFGSVSGGTGAFAAAVASAFLTAGGRIEYGCGATGLERSGGGWAVASGPAGRQEADSVDAVVLAVPSSVAAKLLDGLVPVQILPATPYASVALVTLVYLPGTAVPPGNGFLVAASGRRAVKAITFVGNKWRHPADAPVVIRASVGRYGEEADLQRTDTELAAVIAADVAYLAGITEPVVAQRVSRWGGALPQYRPGHLERVAALRTGLPRGLVVCGAAYDGVGIPACVGSGTYAARDLLGQLKG